MIQTLIRDILNFRESMTEEERDNYIASAAAFANIVLNSSNPKRHVNEVIMEGSMDSADSMTAEASTWGDKGFRLNDNLFRNTKSLCRNLMSVFHENAHIFNDGDVRGVNVTDFALLFQGETINQTREEYGYCIDFMRTYCDENGEICSDAPQAEVEKFKSLTERSQFVKKTIFKAYCNQPHEVRAREWGNAILGELFRLANVEMECGDLTITQQAMLRSLEKQLELVSAEEEEVSQDLLPPTKEELLRLKDIVMETRAKYEDQLEDYIKMQDLQKLMFKLTKITPNPVEYITTSLRAYYDDNLAHNVVSKMLENFTLDPSEYGSALVDIFVFTEFEFDNDELAKFNTYLNEENYFDLSLCDGCPMDELRRIKEHNLKGKKDYDVLDPDIAERMFAKGNISHMPHRTIGEVMDID